MTSLLDNLRGGPRMSLGNADNVAAQVLENPELLGVLFTGFSDDDKVVKARTAAAFHRVAMENPRLVRPFKSRFLCEISPIDQWEVRERFCLTLPCFDLAPEEVMQVQQTLYTYLEYYSSIVRTCAMQALVDLTALDPSSTRKVKKLIAELTETGTPAMRARGAKLLKVLARRP